MDLDIKNCYSNIAKDFSKTRFTVWKGVRDFLDTVTVNSNVGDIGCGNGKNMLYRKDDINYYGIDICPEFVEICKSRMLNVNLGNILNISYDDNFFDHVMSIAVIHHFYDIKDRIKAISELTRICKVGGKILIYVWSYNQYEDSKRKFVSKDEMVPFHIPNSSTGEVFYRYYHLYDTEELLNEINTVKNIKIIKHFNEKNNECVIIQKIWH